MTNVPRLTALELQNAELKRVLKLAHIALDQADEPDCGCEYQHGHCVAMRFRLACIEFDKEAEKVLGKDWNH